MAKKYEIIKRPEFDLEFEYIEEMGIGEVVVRRLSGSDILQVIRFYGNDKLKTFDQFKDVCTTWCDMNIA